jgi:NADH:ubiquinone oxidoreductase subunit 2 (subunit N)
MMYMHEPSEAASQAEPISAGLGAALILPALGTLVLGIVPGWVLDFAGRSANLGH